MLQKKEFIKLGIGLLALVFLIIVVIQFHLIKVPNFMKPTSYYKIAKYILKSENWIIDDASDSSMPGCLTAKKEAQSGQICFNICNQLESDEIQKSVGQAFGYIIHPNKKNNCEYYTTFSGSIEFKKMMMGN